MHRFVVELATPDAGWDDVQALAARARRAAAGAEGVRFLRTIYLPEDGTCALLLEGESAEAVREVGERAGELVERLTPTEVLGAREETRCDG